MYNTFEFRNKNYPISSKNEGVIFSPESSHDVAHFIHLLPRVNVGFHLWCTPGWNVGIWISFSSLWRLFSVLKEILCHLYFSILDLPADSPGRLTPRLILILTRISTSIIMSINLLRKFETKSLLRTSLGRASSRYRIHYVLVVHRRTHVDSCTFVHSVRR